MNTPQHPECCTTTVVQVDDCAAHVEAGRRMSVALSVEWVVWIGVAVGEWRPAIGAVTGT